MDEQSPVPGLPERLRRARLLLGLTQEGMAALVGVSKVTWQNHESGKHEPKASVLAAVVNQGLSADWLLTGRGVPQPGKVPIPHEGDEVGDQVLAALRYKIEKLGLSELIARLGPESIEAHWDIMDLLLHAPSEGWTAAEIYHQLRGSRRAADAGQVARDCEYLVEQGKLKVVHVAEGGLRRYLFQGSKIFRSHHLVDVTWGAQDLIRFIGQEVLPAVERQDSSGGLAMYRIPTNQAPAAALEWHRRTRKLVEEYSVAEASGGLTIILGYAEHTSRGSR